MIDDRKFFGIISIITFSLAILLILSYPNKTRYSIIEVIGGKIEHGKLGISVEESLIFDSIAYAQDTSLNFSMENIGEVKITAERSIYNMRDGTIELIGNIKFRSEKIYAELDRARIYLKDEKVEKIIGRGNITIITGGKEAKSDEVEIFPKNKELILKGNPQVIQKNLRIKGNIIKINLDSDNVEVKEMEAEMK